MPLYLGSTSGLGGTVESSKNLVQLLEYFMVSHPLKTIRIMASERSREEEQGWPAFQRTEAAAAEHWFCVLLSSTEQSTGYPDDPVEILQVPKIFKRTKFQTCCQRVCLNNETQ